MVIKDLLKFNEHSLPENFVSIAVEIDNEKIIPFHAAILIRHKNINYLHHYPGSKPPEVIENFNESGWHIYKIIDSIRVDDANEVGAFLQHCKRICNKSSITYSYICDSSYYDSNGDFVSSSGLPELGTCVGFCLNTLSNTLIDLEESIIELSDWDDSENDKPYDKWSLSQVTKKYPDLDWTLYNTFKKRITPLEYLCISFFDKYPIKKASVNSIKANVRDYIYRIYSTQT